MSGASAASAEEPLFETRRGGALLSNVLAWVYMLACLGVVFISREVRAFERIAPHLPAAVRSIPYLAVHVWVVGAIVALGVFCCLAVFHEPRMGRARFFADRIELDKYVIVVNPRGEKHVLPWSGIVAYDDASASFVRLVRSRPRMLDSLRLTVPTPGEKERLLLLAELERRGIRRA